jgi:hypothetical protein
MAVAPLAHASFPRTSSGKHDTGAPLLPVPTEGIYDLAVAGYVTGECRLILRGGSLITAHFLAAVLTALLCELFQNAETEVRSFSIFRLALRRAWRQYHTIWAYKQPPSAPSTSTWSQPRRPLRSRMLALFYVLLRYVPMLCLV